MRRSNRHTMRANPIHSAKLNAPNNKMRLCTVTHLSARTSHPDPFLRRENKAAPPAPARPRVRPHKAPDSGFPKAVEACPSKCVAAERLSARSIRRRPIGNVLRDKKRDGTAPLDRPSFAADLAAGHEKMPTPVRLPTRGGCPDGRDRRRPRRLMPIRPLKDFAEHPDRSTTDGRRDRPTPR